MTMVPARTEILHVVRETLHWPVKRDVLLSGT